MKIHSIVVGVILVVASVLIAGNVQGQNKATGEHPGPPPEVGNGIDAHVRQMLENGRRVFRYDTFGSEAFWGETLQLHRAIAGEKNAGIDGGVSPKTALSVGLKVDADALPAPLKRQIKDGKVDLDDPATTLAPSQAECGRRRHGLVQQAGKPHLDGTDDSFAPGSANARTGGPTVTLTSVSSCRWLRTSRRSPSSSASTSPR